MRSAAKCPHNVTVRGALQSMPVAEASADVYMTYERLRCFMLSINGEVWLTVNQWAIKRRETSYSDAPPPDGTLAKPKCDIIESSEHVDGVATGQRVAQIKAICGWYEIAQWNAKGDTREIVAAPPAVSQVLLRLSDLLANKQMWACSTTISMKCTSIMAVRMSFCVTLGQYLEKSRITRSPGSNALCTSSMCFLCR